ncbi:4-hydroxy-tetrahydrodipicolinate reductase [Adhaeribacter aerolatus]|uniref:4-hydroxy-tetrahydrodipicolinate reductase n=1 Tax=Adhaeribacter aerolatus TaxID=670289 RepID=A0A512B4J5_9BACT|nr:4-hydroxy-tetrahydrodipicolinate reductase [Adhaeribacter aerolatus]GEO06893.1 4-hydroxy-tetrahydrodipicolinate reductase [Adhaeribacter aerolatus]
MRILLIGYGKMGKTIEQIALQKGHELAGIIDIQNRDSLKEYNHTNTDVAIEFTHPESAPENIKYCLQHGIPVVSGSTGWMQHFEEIKDLCRQNNGSFFYASNYSVGVNLFFHFNEYIATKMQAYEGFHVEIKEVHHTQKVDKPSGTAITTAEGLLNNYPAKNKWVSDAAAPGPQELNIISERYADVVGLHTVKYTSEHDTIELTHNAHSRIGFAEGAVMAAEWLPGKKGIYGMKDLLNL